MKRTTTTMLVLGMLLLVTTAALATAPYSYSSAQPRALVPLPYGPAAYPGATAGLWTNPAGVGADGSSGFLFGKPVSTDGYDNVYSDDLAWGINLDGLGFGVEYSNGDVEARRYTLALSDEIVEGLYFGTAYHWSSGLDLQNAWDFGLLARPTEWLSIGATATEAFGGNFMGQEADPTYNVGLAVRPMGVHWLTLTGDVTFSRVGVDAYPIGMIPAGEQGIRTPNGAISGYRNVRTEYFEDVNPTFTASIRPIDGITINAGYAVDSEVVFGGINFSLGNLMFGGWSGNNSDNTSGRPDDAGFDYFRISSQYDAPFFEPWLPKKVVKMKLRGRLVEEEVPFSFFSSPSPTVLSKVQQLDRIAEDETVTGLWLDVKGFGGQIADMEEIRDALQRVKDAGKTIVVYSDGFSGGTYYLASVADKIVMLPTGTMTVIGLNAEGMFFRNLLDSIHVEPQVVKIEEYKSAFEMATENKWTEPAREQIAALLDVFYDEWTGAIADGRGVAQDEVKGWVDGAMYSGGMAHEMGMVDTLAYDDEAHEIVTGYIAGDDDVRVISSHEYFMMEEADLAWENMTSPKVAMIFAEGPIMTGRSGRTPWSDDPYIGAETVASAIRAARNDKRVKAIVLRVDSPGGSAEASDIIAREIDLTVNPKDDDATPKPVIVSMSGVAASGGYYIACLADTIVAQRTTITGSIGVIGANLAYEAALDSIGITYDRIMRGANADIWSGNGWNEEQRKIIRREIEIVYDQFTSLVAKGRGMEQSEVNEVGRGRVWAGEDAMDINLVDVEGGMYEAIQIAKDAAGLDPDETIPLKLYMAKAGWLPDRELSSIAMRMMPGPIGDLLIKHEEMTRFDPNEVQMLAPIDGDDIEME